VHVKSGVADPKSLHDDNLGYAKLFCNTDNVRICVRHECRWCDGPANGLSNSQGALKITMTALGRLSLVTSTAFWMSVCILGVPVTTIRPDRGSNELALRTSAVKHAIY
jgi:hypothetical protein